jgi:hypothetical protein
MVALAVFACLGSFSARLGAQYTNMRIFPSAVTQTEPVAAVSPVDPLLMFASAVTINTSNAFKSEGVYVSTDGGLHWFGSDSCRGALIVNHGGDPGIAITASSRFVLNHIGYIFPGVYSHYSTDLGTTWSNAYTLTSQQPEDKGTTTIDNMSGSLFQGRLYSAWVNLVVPYPVVVSYSTNEGVTWTPPTAVNPAPPARCSGGSIRVGRDGRVYVCWAAMTAAPFIEDFAGFASSTDGGATWSFSQNIFDMNGINGTLAAKSNIRVNGLPQIAIDNSHGAHNGWLYIVTAQQNLPPAGGDPDIVLYRSTNGGAAWSPGIRVNQDPLNNGKIQYFPAMEIDSSGGVNIIFCDDRNTSSDSAEVILARSGDAGITWTERVISDHRFKPKPIIGGSSTYQGDHLELLAVGSKLFAFWMDDYAGLYQIWLAIVDLATDVSDDGAMGIPSNFTVHQNHPNPFNPTTTIEVNLPREMYVTLKVYNVLGQEVATLADAKRVAAGRQEFRFHAHGLMSGVYFYRVTAEATTSNGSIGGAFTAVKKMLLLK